MTPATPKPSPAGTLRPGEHVEFAGGYVARSYSDANPFYAEHENVNGESIALSPPQPTFDAACAWLAEQLGISAIDGQAARLALYARSLA